MRGKVRSAEYMRPLCEIAVPELCRTWLIIGHQRSHELGEGRCLIGITMK